MEEVIKGVSITVALCTITHLGGRKKDSQLIAMAGCSFILIYILSAINGATVSVDSSWVGDTFDKMSSFIDWISN